MPRRAAPASGSSSAGPVPPSQRELEAALARALSPRAAAVTLAIAAPPVSFSSLVAAFDGAMPFFAWREPTGAIRGGLGAAVRFSRDGAGTLAAAGELSARLATLGPVRHETLLDAAPVALRAFAGGAFDPASPGKTTDTCWNEWPGSLAVLPRLLYESDGSRASLAIVRVDGDGAEDDARHAESARVLLAALARPGTSVRCGGADHDELPVDAAWSRAVDAALDAMHGGTLRKVVLARARDALLREGDAAHAIAGRLEERTREGTLVAIGLPGSTFLAATPETLVSRAGTRVAADALAGTASEDDAKCLGEKELREQALVVDAVSASLARFCSRVEAEDAPTVARADGAVHLRTRVWGELSSRATVVDLAAALHPTPAVAGTPRDAALAWLREHEGLSRGWYSGPFGWFDANGDGRFVVLLRCALVAGRRARIFAGAGLVEGSDAAAEFAETELKMRPLLDALGVKS